MVGREQRLSQILIIGQLRLSLFDRKSESKRDPALKRRAIGNSRSATSCAQLPFCSLFSDTNFCHHSRIKFGWRARLRNASARLSLISDKTHSISLSLFSELAQRTAIQRGETNGLERRDFHPENINSPVIACDQWEVYACKCPEKLSSLLAYSTLKRDPAAGVTFEFGVECETQNLAASTVVFGVEFSV